MKKDASGNYLPGQSLRNRLLMNVLPVLTGMICFILLVNFFYQMQNGKAAAARTLSLVADSYENEIDLWLNRRNNEVLLTAANPVIKDNVERIMQNGPDAAAARIKIEKYLRTMVQRFPVYDEIYGLSPGGRIIFSTNPARVDDVRPTDNILKWPMEHGGVYFQDAYFSYSTRKPSVAYSVAIDGPDRRHLAVLVFRVSTSEFLDSIAQGQVRLGPTGEVMLLRHDRITINELRNKPGSSLSYRATSLPAIRAVNGEEGVSQAVGYDNRPVMAAYRNIPFAGWGLVVKQDMNEIMAPVWRSTLLMMLPGLGGLLLLILLVTFFIGRTVTPLREVTHAAAALTRGEFGQRIEVGRRRDEIGALSQSFNEMAASLQAQFNARERLQKLLELLVANIQIAPLMSAALESIARSHNMAVGAIYLYRVKTQTLKRIATYSPSQKLQQEEEIPAGIGAGGQALASRQPVVLDDIPDNTSYTVKTISGEFLPATIYHLPLVFGERVLGLLVLGSINKPEADCLEQLQAAAAMLAVALNNALTFEQVQNLSEELAGMNEELSAQNEELQTQAEELQAQAEELQAQGRELAEKNQQLEQATQAKSAFLARMSHELRTPLNAILGFSEILLDGLFGDLNAKQQEYLKDILSSGRHLLALINDILDLSKIEAGRMELAPRPVDPLESLHEALILTWPEAVRKRLQIDIQFSSGQFKVLADPERLKQVFVNLLSNAIKFSPSNGKITASAGRGEQELVMRIIDQGPGIAPEMHKVIFEEFKQGGQRPDAVHQGTGLGLAITKRLVEMHSGRIWVDSRPGCGATFNFTLPLADEFHVPVAAEQTGEVAVTADEDVVLLVEDDPSARKLLEAYLHEEGYKVVTAAGGEEALHLVHVFSPWVIILDVLLPDKDGWEVLNELKENGETKNIPVIIVSALDEAGRGLSLGALDYFVKPVDKELLLSRLRCVKGFSGEAPTIMVVDDEPKVVDYLAVVLESAGYRVSRATSGKKALEMIHSVPPDVMILDLIMPEMTGFDVLKQLADEPLAQKIRIFILTAGDLTAAEKDKLNRQVMAVARKGELSREQFLLQLERVRKMMLRKG